MFKKLAVAAVSVVLAAGSVACGAEAIVFGGSDTYAPPTEEFFDVFFDVFMAMPVVDNGDTADGVWLDIDRYYHAPVDDGDGYNVTEGPWLELVHPWRTIRLDR